MAARLIVYGDALMDITALIQSLPNQGGDIISDSITLVPGGSAANCAVIAARLGIDVKFVGVLSNDRLGTFVLEDLQENGVDTSFIKMIHGKTATVIDLIDQSGEHTMISCRGAAANELYGKIDPALFQEGDIFHVSGYVFQSQSSKSTAIELIHLAKKAGAKISLDPSYNFARTAMQNHKEILSQLDYFFPNESEMQFIAQSASEKDALKYLKELGMKTIILKKGAAGCYLADRTNDRLIEAYQVRDVVDTTGAGDAFAGGFLAGRIKGLTPYQSVKLGHACAAIIVTAIGGHSAPLDFDILSRFADEFQDEELGTAIKILWS